MAKLKKKQPPPSPPPVVSPPPATTPPNDVPTGRITTAGISGMWEDITRYDAVLHEFADPVGWPLPRLRATIAIESGGNPMAVQQNASNGWSYGLMQIVHYGVGWEGWHELVHRTARLITPSRDDIIEALYDPLTNIAVGVTILESLYVQHGTLDKANSAFFLGNPDWRGADTVNGNTGTWYQRTLHALIEEQGGTAPPTTVADPVQAILGNMPTNTDYGYKSPTTLPYYGYFVGHGGNANQHTGIDATTTLGQRLYSPISGTVVCGGTGNGAGAWGTGCAAFPDYMGQGAGRVEILAEDGRHSLILGHCSRSLVSPGQHVTAGQAVAEAGGMNGNHVHIEGRVWTGSDYLIIEPREMLRALMRGEPVVFYAERIPVAQPQDLTTFVTVTVTAEEVPVLQRADRTSPQVAAPIKKGDTFEAAQIQLGDSGEWFWIGRLGSRVPIAGTTSDKVPTWR
jgi:murein DD-endopeptidase MepM/ murein hydrolase activator NlpD